MKKKLGWLDCPYCEGEGSWWEPVLWGGPGGGPLEECSVCDGKGRFSVYGRLHLWVWEHMPVRIIEWVDRNRTH